MRIHSNVPNQRLTDVVLPENIVAYLMLCPFICYAVKSNNKKRKMPFLKTQFKIIPLDGAVAH